MKLKILKLNLKNINKKKFKFNQYYKDKKITILI